MAKVYDFVSPFNITICKSRLEGITEKTNVLASKYARRTKIDVWNISRISVGFKVYKMSRPALQFIVSRFSLQVRGKLQARPDGGTTVVYQVWQNPLGMIGEGIVGLLLGVPVALIFLMFMPEEEKLNILQLQAIFIMAATLSVGAIYIYRYFTRTELLAVVRLSLSDLDTEPLDERKNEADLS